MVFRKDNKVDAFQRQISALRQQLGTGEDAEEESQPAAEGRTPVERPAPTDSFQRPGGYGATFNDAPTGARGFGDFASAAPASGEGGGIVGSPDPELPAVPVVDARTTVIAHDTTWKGDLDSQGTIHVHGRFEGAIRAGADVYIADDADVDANVIATNVVVAGLMKGSVRCSSRFEVLPSGRVSGDILAPTLVVHEGATLTGQFRMGAEESAESPPAAVVQRRAARGSA